MSRLEKSVEKVANVYWESHGGSIGKKENNICGRLISEKSPHCLLRC